jgi:hypothetical protein
MAGLRSAVADLMEALMHGVRKLAIAVLATLAAGCAADQPPDPGTLVNPADLLAQLVGNTTRGSSSATAGVSFFESSDRQRFRTRILSSGQEYTDRGTLSVQGDALCSTPDTVFERRTFCSKWYRTPTGFRTVPTDNRPGSRVELLPGNPEGL